MPNEPEGLDTKFWLALTDTAQHPVSLSGNDIFTIYEKGVQNEGNLLPEVAYTYNTSETVKTNAENSVTAVNRALNSQISV